MYVLWVVHSSYKDAGKRGSNSLRGWWGGRVAMIKAGFYSLTLVDVEVDTCVEELDVYKKCLQSNMHV